MNNKYLVQKEEVGNYRIKIYYDIDAECPADNWDGESKFYMFYGRDVCTQHTGRYKEVADCKGKSFSGTLEKLVMWYVPYEDILNYLKKGRCDNASLTYNRSTHEWDLHVKWGCCYPDSFEPDDLKNGFYKDEMVGALDDESLIELLDECKDIAIEVDFAHECRHSIAITDMEVRRMCFGKDAKWDSEWAERHVEGTCKDMNRWGSGEVFGFVLEQLITLEQDPDNDEEAEYEEVESVWGYFMEPEELIEEVKKEYIKAA